MFFALRGVYIINKHDEDSLLVIAPLSFFKNYKDYSHLENFNPEFSFLEDEKSFTKSWFAK